MKLLALEHEKPGCTPADYQPYLWAEAIEVWNQYQGGIIRELYFRTDQSTAVLILECDSVAEGQAALERLPLVRAGLITFEVIPLAAYPGFARLFVSQAAG